MDIVSRCVNSILNIFESFNGVGFVFVVFLMCIAFLSIKEKNAYIKDALVKYPLYVLVVFFCPIWYIYIYLFFTLKIYKNYILLKLAMYF